MPDLTTDRFFIIYHDIFFFSSPASTLNFDDSALSSSKFLLFPALIPFTWFTAMFTCYTLIKVFLNEFFLDLLIQFD